MSPCREPDSVTARARWTVAPGTRVGRPNGRAWPRHRAADRGTCLALIDRRRHLRRSRRRPHPRKEDDDGQEAGRSPTGREAGGARPGQVRSQQAGVRPADAGGSRGRQEASGSPRAIRSTSRPPSPARGAGGKDILDGDRSDRESGRPIQLEDDAERESFPPGQPGQADAERGQGGRPQEGTRGSEAATRPRRRSADSDSAEVVQARRPWRRLLQGRFASGRSRQMRPVRNRISRMMRTKPRPPLG